jgi:hypothetical protein
MVNRIGPVGVVFFILVAACGAECQNAGELLPDAPSKQAAIKEQNFNVFTPEARSSSRFRALGIEGVLTYRGRFGSFDEPISSQTDSNTIMGKYLQPTAPTQPSSYTTSSSGSMMGRPRMRLRAFLSRGMSPGRAG